MLLLVRDPVKYLRKLGVKIGNNVRITKYPYFWSYPNVGSEPHLISIGDNCIISFGVTFITHDAGINISRKINKKYEDLVYYGTIEIGNNVFIGCNSIIMPNITIGSNSIVGAGSLVTRNIPPGEVWAGNPAHFICTVEEYSEKKYLISKNIPSDVKRNLKVSFKENTTVISKYYKDGISDSNESN